MYQQDPDRCPGCNTRVPANKKVEHIKTCQKYNFTVYKDINRIQQSIPLNVLHFMKAELQLSLEKVKTLINNKQQDFSDLIEEDIQPSFDQNKKRSQVKMDLAYYGASVVTCSGCDRKYYQNYDRQMLVHIYGCWHVFCLLCVNKYIDTEFVNQVGNLKCLQKMCSQTIEEQQIRGIIGKQKYETLYNKALKKMYNAVQCFKCHSQYQFIPGNPKDAPKKDNNGKQIKQEHAKHYAQNRYICFLASCKTEQCKSCQANPYHLGMNCKEYKDRSLQKKCRYCVQPLTQKNLMIYNNPQDKALIDICKNVECQSSAKYACRKILACKHPCNGFKGQKQCLPCLNEICAASNKQLNGINGDQYCAICYIQSLASAPCIRSSCGHIFHIKCLKKRFEIKWLTPRILFNFCLCPLCKKWISVTAEKFQTLYQKIQKMASQRLKFQQLQKSDPKLIEKTSIYYGKPVQYAMAIYAYFMCFKCKKPYFGGRKDCMAAMNQQNAGGVFKAQQLICANCCDIPIQNCPKHGKDFIQFKCKFCCNVAQWFCWGNTHFCQPCHKRQVDGDYVSKYTKQQLPKCLGVGKCNVGGNHNGNGQQRMLGCAICRNYKENNKNF